MFCSKNLLREARRRIPAPWTEIDQADLDKLRNALIELSDTAYGWFEEEKKRDIERALHVKMSAVEKGDL